MALRIKNLENELRELKAQLLGLNEKSKEMANHQTQMENLIKKLEESKGNDITKIISEIKSVSDKNKSTLEKPIRIAPPPESLSTVKEQKQENVSATAIFSDFNKSSTVSESVLEMTASKEKAASAHFKFAEFKFRTGKPKLQRKQDFSIVSNLKEKALQTKNPVSAMAPKLLMRMITYFYSILLKYRKNQILQTALNNVTLPIIMHKELTNKYGLKHVADRKFLQVFFSIMKCLFLDNGRMYGV